MSSTSKATTGASPAEHPYDWTPEEQKKLTTLVGRSAAAMERAQELRDAEALEAATVERVGGHIDRTPVGGVAALSKNAKPMPEETRQCEQCGADFRTCFALKVLCDPCIHHAQHDRETFVGQSQKQEEARF